MGGAAPFKFKCCKLIASVPSYAWLDDRLRNIAESQEHIHYRLLRSAALCRRCIKAKECCNAKYTNAHIKQNWSSGSQAEPSSMSSSISTTQIIILRTRAERMQSQQGLTWCCNPFGGFWHIWRLLLSPWWKIESSIRDDLVLLMVLDTVGMSAFTLSNNWIYVEALASQPVGGVVWCRDKIVSVYLSLLERR